MSVEIIETIILTRMNTYTHYHGGTQMKLPNEFWNIYRSIKLAHPDYSNKRIMTVARYAYQKRYGVELTTA